MTVSETSGPSAPWSLSSAHAGALLRMERLVRDRRGFTLLVAGFGDSAYRDRVLTYLADGWLGGATVDAGDADGDFGQLEDRIGAAARHGAVQVVGLEHWPGDSGLLWHAFNHHRERIASLCPAPLLVWVPRVAARLLATEAPDLWAWRSGVFKLREASPAPTIEPAGIVVDRGSAASAERRDRVQEISEHLDRLDAVTHPADLALLIERGELLTDLGDPPAAALDDFEAAIAGYEKADDRFGEARARSLVADLTSRAGDPTSALTTLLSQVLPVYDQLGDIHSRAITWGRIADIHYQRGNLDEALRIRREQLPVFDQLGDIHSRASAWGRIAAIHYQRGDLDEALRIHEEQLPVYNQLGDIDGIAAANWSMALILRAQDDDGAALPKLLTAYELLTRTGRALGIASVGEVLGAQLLSTGERERALAILARSHECYEMVGRRDDAARVAALIAEPDTERAQ
ncbi:MAG: tetratricopeptide repeat protein [Acidimicrobiia bacterium]|nr:tetratricopeptide repeat protein [Acidimicrobiia bacterium]